MKHNRIIYHHGNSIHKRKTTKKKPKTIYIHAGIYKTATTTIQFLLKKYETDLNKKGIYIPKAGILHTKTIYNHSPLIYEIIKYDDPKKWEYLKSILIEIKNISYNTILLSAEDTSYLYLFPKKLHKLNNIFNSYGFNVKIIISDRSDTANFIISMYTELLKSGYYTKDMYEYVKELKRDYRINIPRHGPKVYLPLNLSIIRKTFQKIFGQKNVIYIKYSNKIVKNFFNIFGITIQNPNQKINKRYSKSKILFMLHFNRMIKKFNVNVDHITVYTGFILRRLPNIGKFDFPEELKTEIRILINKQKNK